MTVKTFFVSIALYGLLMGCSTDKAVVSPAIDDRLLIGSWQISQLSAEPAVISATYGSVTDMLLLYKQQIGKDCVAPTRYVFNSDGSLRLQTSTDCQSRLTSLFGFTSAIWRVDKNTLQVEGVYDKLTYQVTEQSATTMSWQRTEYNSPVDGQSHVYTIRLTKF